MESTNTLLTNKPIPETAQPIIDRMIAEGNAPLFVIVGDLEVGGRYGYTALAMTETTLTTIAGDGTAKTYPYADLRDVRAKRMYGNATLSARMPDGKRVVFFRYTYAVATLCDAVAPFINHINAGAVLDSELGVMEVLFEKGRSTCPKCGRTLLRPGAECIKCRSKFQVIKQLSKYLKPQTLPITVSIFLSIFTTFAGLIPPVITGFIFDAVLTEGGKSDVGILNWMADWVGGEARAVLFAMIGLLLGIFVVQYIVGAFRAYLMRKVGDKIVTSLRNDIYRKAQYLPMRFYDKTSTGAVINRIASDSSNLQGFLLRITQEAVVHAFSLVGIAIIMLVLNPYLTLLSLIPVVFIVVATRIFSTKIRSYYKRSWMRWNRVVGLLTDTIPCIRVVKSFAGEKRTANKFEDKNNDWLRIDLKILKMATAFPQVVGFLTTCSTLIIWAVGGVNVLNGVEGYSAGMIVTFVTYAGMFFGPVTFFANLSDSFQSALASTEKILDIIDAEPEAAEDDGKIIPEKFNGQIEFSHVTFAFDRSKKVLDDVSFTVMPGEVVGIVGTTGSGKSTLVNLLMRFYDNYTGDILVDGQNVKDMNVSAYRGQIGYVQQEPMMFSDTIYNNIAFSDPDATVEDVIHAADVANAHGFIAKQPEAYDTVLGERGVGVSGGEKQRISIARAVLKSPSIMIFDEATAAVDSKTERLIQDAIDRLIAGKTTLMIAHRLSTLRRANRIIVVDNGKIIENGTPEELMAMKGKYYDLVQIQSMGKADSKEG